MYFFFATFCTFHLQNTVRPLDKNDFGYLIEHLHGQTVIAYDEYDYALPLKKLKRETLVKRYDLIKPTRCLIDENQRYLKNEQEEQTTYVAYFTINSIVGDLEFPSDEIFYYQQQQFDFPIDIYMNVEIVTNKMTFYTIRYNKNKIKELDTYSIDTDNETGS